MIYKTIILERKEYKINYCVVIYYIHISSVFFNNFSIDEICDKLRHVRSMYVIIYKFVKV